MLILIMTMKHHTNAIELMPSSEFHYTDVSKRGPGSDFCCWDVSWFSFTAYWFQFVNLNVMCMNSYVFYFGNFKNHIRFLESVMPLLLISAMNILTERF